MDLSQRGHLSATEKTMLSQTLQIFTLDGLASGISDLHGRMVFHGGTSISTVHGSPRWSEDLDFVISPSMSIDLENLRASVERTAAARIDEITPGAKFTLTDKGKATGKVREGDPGEVVRWVGRWEHPNRIGVVKIKNEFYVAEPEVVRTYDTLEGMPSAIGLACSDALPCATMETIWADKIMAMSARPVMKWRDVFDMGYIMERIGAVPDDVLYERMGVATRSYRSTLSELHANLARPELKALEQDYHTFEADMKKWLAGPDFERHLSEGQLRQYHGACVDQIIRARNIIEDYIPELKDDELTCDF
jgi:hypothetical protein